MNPVNQLSSIIVLLWDSSQEYEWVTKSITSLALDLREGGPDTEELWSESTTHPSYGEYTLADLIVGAYWHYADYHGGQDRRGTGSIGTQPDLFAQFERTPRRQQQPGTPRT